VPPRKHSPITKTVFPHSMANEISVGYKPNWLDSIQPSSFCASTKASSAIFPAKRQCQTLALQFPREFQSAFRNWSRKRHSTMASEAVVAQATAEIRSFVETSAHYIRQIPMRQLPPSLNRFLRSHYSRYSLLCPSDDKTLSTYTISLFLYPLRRESTSEPTCFCNDLSLLPLMKVKLR
jgi:hypothetical protein